jgi:quinol monooxygenase YgiN
MNDVRPKPWRACAHQKKVRPRMSLSGMLSCHDFRNTTPKEVTMPSHEIARISAAETGYLTLINVYEVEPEKQTELIKLLSEVTETTIRKQPGFVSVSIHGSLDGGRVVNYAQWASKDHFENFIKKPEIQSQLKRFASLAKTVSPGLYKVNAVHAE